eukprot:CAMPEP_0185748084 /NCGR_PEP_ID=MMETSP1174-20130828/6743_1 /TAXON_ID=35687 /ORGANISM="Dictyocha speculum, Strain CCMP1381" /LENGTH=258 /DNA_ID=CAMNT_0028423575 /DNA_START=131 /DNA_END=904 /DNA_ORIENTATION=+
MSAFTIARPLPSSTKGGKSSKKKNRGRNKQDAQAGTAAVLMQTTTGDSPVQARVIPTKGWRKPSIKGGVRRIALPAPGARGDAQLSKRLSKIIEDDDTSSQLVEGFDLQRSPRYRFFYEQVGRRNRVTPEAAATNRGRKNLTEALELEEKLNAQESQANIALLIVDADLIMREESCDDGYDMYFVVQNGPTQVWCGRSSALGMGPRTSSGHQTKRQQQQQQHLQQLEEQQRKITAAQKQRLNSTKSSSGDSNNGGESA